MTSRVISKYWTAVVILVACSSQADRRPAADRGVVLGSTSQALEPSCTFVAKASGGSDTAAGTELAPWKTLSRALAPTSAFMTTGGQTLCLRAGTYNAWQLLPALPSGTETSPTTIRSYPGERATIDTSLPEFLPTNNSAWVPVEGQPGLYRSALTYASLGRPTHATPGSDQMGGFFRQGDEYHALISYRSMAHLTSTSELYDAVSAPEARPGYYAGPGIFWEPGGYIYIRLTRPTANAVGATYTVPSNVNPTQVPIHISYTCDPGCVAINLQGSNIVLRDMDLIHGGMAFRNWGSNGADHHITFQNLRIHARTGMYIGGQAHHINVLDSQFECHLPPWIAGDDMEQAPNVAGRLRGAGLVAQGLSYLFFENSRIERCYDGIRPTGNAALTSHHIDVLHNEILGVRDDGIELGTNLYEVEVGHNRILGGSQGLGVVAAGESPQPGSVFVHHNVIQTRPIFKTRRTLANVAPVQLARAPIAPYDQPELYGGTAPLKLYNNTLIAEPAASQTFTSGLGHEYLAMRSATPTLKHEVLNNVLYVIGATPIGHNAAVSSPQELYDGNIYWRTTTANLPSLWAPLYWDNPSSGTSKPFQTLNNFRQDNEYWCATKTQYEPGWERAGHEADPRLAFDFSPNFDGPAGAAAIDLSARGWPGTDLAHYRGALPVLTDRVLGAWTFDTSATQDSGGYGLTATVLGNPSVASGHTGNGITLDGVDDSLRIVRTGPLVKLEERSFTFSTWYRGGGITQALFSNRGNNSSFIRVAFNNYSPGVLDSQVGSARYYKVGFFPQDGQWHHLMVSVSLRHARDYNVDFYMDGVLGASEANWISGEKIFRTSGSADFLVGSDYPGGNEFIGQLDDVRILNGAHRPDGLIGYFNFDAQSVPSGSDLSGQGSIGAPYGGAAINTAGFDGPGLNLPAAGAGFSVAKRGALASLASGSFTVSFWYRGGDAGSTLFKNAATGSASIHAYRPAGSDDALGLDLGTASYEAPDAFVPGDNGWHLFTLSVQKTSPTAYQPRAYVDGRLVLDPGDQTSTGALLLEAGGSDLHFGAAEAGAGTLVGQVDEIRVYGYARVPTLDRTPPVVSDCAPVGCGDGVVSGSEVCDTAINAWCNRDCTASDSLNVDCTNCGPGQACPSEPNGPTFNLEEWRRVCIPTVHCGAASNDCGTATDSCGNCACTPNCSTKTCGADPGDGCGGVCRGLCQPGQLGALRDTDCPVGFVLGVGNAWRFGHATAPNANVCWPVLCEDFDPRRIECGSTSSPCGLCDPQVANHCFDGVMCDNSPATQCPAGSAKNMAGQCIGDVSLGLTDEIDTNEVGALPGVFAVTDRGSATYTVPIALPPGRAGFTPALSIDYDSSARNSAVGYGWRVSGFSVVSTCNASIAQDGSLSAKQAYLCLDGKRLVPKRLVAVGDIPMTEWVTEQDTFAHVYSPGDLIADASGDRTPLFFVVYNKNGTTARYGLEQGARLGGRIDISDQAYFTVRTWAVSEIVDRAGNIVKFSYARNFAEPNVELIPKWIGYNFVTPGREATDAVNEIVFTYAREGEVLPAHCTTLASTQDSSCDGFPMAPKTYIGDPGMSRLLQNVTVHAHGKAIRQYRLRHAKTASGLSLVRRVTECTFSGASSTEACRPETTFNYEDTNLIFPERLYVSPPITQQVLALDWNNDGYDDLAKYIGNTWQIFLGDRASGLQFSPATTVQSPTPLTGVDERGVSIQPAFVSDLDGDSFADLVVQAKDSQGRAVLQRFEGNSGTDPQPIPITWPSGAKSVAAFHSLDINGDQLDDLIYCDTGGKAYLYTNNAGTLSNPALLGDVKACESAVATNFRDGRETLFFGNTRYIAQTGPATFQVADSSIAPSSWLRLHLSADFNGDGLLDLLYIPARPLVGFPGVPTDTRIEVYYGTGTDWKRGETLSNAEISQARMVSSIDYDHDGRADLLVGKPVGATTQWLLYRGADLRGSPLVLATFSGANQKLSAVFLDANGDGRGDIYANGDGGLFLGRNPHANRLTSIAIPAHAQAVPDRVDVTYASGRGDLAFNPIDVGTCGQTTSRMRCENSLPYPIVAGVSRTSYIQDSTHPGTNAQYSQESYRYEGSVSDRGGRGWLGFKRRTAQYTGRGGVSFEEVTDEYQVEPRDASYGSKHFYYYPFLDVPTKTVETWEVPASAITVDGSFIGRVETVREFDVRTSADGLEFTAKRSEIVTTSEGAQVEQSATSFEVDHYGNLIEESTTWPHDPYRLDVRGFVPAYTEDPTRGPKWQVDLMAASYSYSIVGTDSSAHTVASYDRYLFNADGLLETVTKRVLPETSADALRTTIIRDERNNPFIVTQHPVSMGANTTFDRTWIYAHDLIAGVYLAEARTPGDHVHHYEFSYADGQLRQYIDPNTVTSSWRYDGFGRVLEERNNTRGIATSYAYEAASLNTAEVVAVNGVMKVVATTFSDEEPNDGIPTESTYDTAGRLVQETSLGFQGVRISSEFEYDTLGRRVSTSRPHVAGNRTQGIRRTQYDGLGRVVGETDANGEFTAFHYASRATAIDLSVQRSDARWFVAEDSQRKGRSLRALDRGNRVVLVREGWDTNAGASSAPTVQYEYGAGGFLRATVDAHGNRIERESDTWGRLTVLRDPDEGVRQYTYNHWDDTETVTHQGETQTYTYDGLGRPKSLMNRDGTTTWSWDSLITSGATRTQLGELLKLSGPDGHSDEFFYGGPGGALDRISRTIAGAAPLDLGIDYDDMDRVRTLHYPGASGLSVRYEYEPRSGIMTHARDLNGPQGDFWRLESAHQGRLPSMVRLGDASSESTSYDELTGATVGRLVRGSAGGTLIDLHVERYEDGTVRFVQRRERTNDPGHFYVYDRLNRLKEVHAGATESATLVAAYGYNLIGNIESKPGAGTYAYGLAGEAPTGPQTLPHAVRKVSTTGSEHEYFYDAFGRVERRIGPSVPGGSQEFTYAATGAVRTIQSTGRLDRFEYNGAGERVRRAISGGPTIAYLDPYYEARTQGTATTEKLHVIVNGRAIAEIAVTPTGAASTTYLHRDHLGSVVAKTGAESAVFDHDEYGNSGIGSPSVDVGEIGWTGHRGEPDLGLVDMKARFYDPLVGRFLAPDPLIAEPLKTQAYNRYTYAYNNPTTLVDPSGFCSIDPETGQPVGCDGDSGGSNGNDSKALCSGPACFFAAVAVAETWFYGWALTKTGKRIKARLEKKRAKEHAKKERKAQEAERRPPADVANPAPLSGDSGLSALHFANWLDRSGVATFVAGWGDTVSFNATTYARNWLGSEGVVDESSTSYTIGSLFGMANSMAVGGTVVLKATGWVKNAVGSVARVAARGGAVAAEGAANAANGVRLAKQLASEAGSAELLAGGGKVMAGAGTKTPIRDVARLVAEHGGQPGDWAKVTSTTYKIVDGVTVEVHGYMNMATRAVVELKSKVGLWSP